MEIIYTKDPEWLKKWDDYVRVENKASHLMLSQWNASFGSYGFDFEICIGVKDGTICGGFAGVIAKALFFKFFIVPYGPIVSNGFEGHLNTLIESVKKRAEHYNCCYCHITLPVSSQSNAHVLSQLPKLEALERAKSGHVFKYVYSSNGLNWIDLKGFDEESKIMTLKTSVRRNIRSSYRKDLVLCHLNTEEKIAEGYRLFEENSKTAGYNIRDWEDMKETLFKLNNTGFLKILGAYKDDQLKGAIMLLQSGNYLTYILGGTVKELPNLSAGDFLQWEAIKMSIDYGFDGYNISLGGSKGVEQFKSIFNTEKVLFDHSKYYWVLQPTVFKIYVFFENRMKPYKKNISKLFSAVKNRK